MDNKRIDAGGITYEELFREAEMAVYITWNYQRKRSVEP